MKSEAAAAKHPSSPQRHLATAAEKRHFAALMKKLTVAHRAAENRESLHRVAVHERRLSPGMAVPPPSYYPPGPYARLVYGGPPSGPYGWGGYSRPYPYGYP